MSALEVVGVSKWFADTVALSDVTFRSEPGVTGLLGHNGAGKSTLFDLLAGFTSPSQGTVRVLGVDPHADPSVHARLGLVPDGDGLWPFLTARQTVAFLARHRGVADPSAAAARALSRVGLDAAADRRVAGFSKGMRQRVRLAQALAHDPEVLLLDEPLNGLDPAQRRADVELLRTLGAEGRTVLVSSHVLGEVERMADRLLVVVNGRLVAEGTPAGVQELLARSARTVRVDTSDPRALAGLLLAEPDVASVSLDDDGLVVHSTDGGRLAVRLPQLARDAGVRLSRVVPLGEDLESVFSRLTASARGVGR
ncbi:MAG: transporter related [Frankiales bacterium]|nr:transporter related [Frankiales bacterium]